MQVVRENDYTEVIEPGQYVVYTGGSQSAETIRPREMF